jgi:hypothetical protein
MLNILVVYKCLLYLVIVDVPDVAGVVGNLAVLACDEGVGQVPPISHTPVGQGFWPK